MSEPIKFLLVDDVPENLVALEALLKRDDLSLHLARSGREALELLLVHDFALALVDVNMPEMDGFELAELMRGTERCKHVPIIFATAAPNDGHRVFKGYESGAVDFLFKPIDPVVLRQKADVFFQLYKQRQQLARDVEEREKLLKEVQETLRLNEMFTAVLGHDLRNPLAAMVMGASAIVDSSSDPKTVRAANRILSSGTRMAEMIERLLDLARARLGGGILIERVPLELSALAVRIVSEVRMSSPGREIRLESTGDSSGRWDEGRLGQVLANLLSNAVKHGAPGAIDVRVDGRDADHVVLTVHNQGCIPEDRLPYIFDPFRSGNNRSDGRGLGLGLYIVDQVIQVHRGTVSARSTAEEGTTFEVRLPRG
jgi:signal transduction histidine kinase